MPSTLQQVKEGPEPESVRKVRLWLEKNVQAEAPYFSRDEILTALKLPSQTAIFVTARLPAYHKKVGPRAWWSLPEYIKKL